MNMGEGKYDNQVAYELLVDTAIQILMTSITSPSHVKLFLSEIVQRAHCPRFLLTD